MQIKARAKINWALNVLGRRADGYHQLEMVNQRLLLADDVYLSPAPAISLAVEGSPDIPADASNLAWRAAMLLKARFEVPQGVHIRLVKRIPSGAGLAGGSADAAAVLLGLNNLWGLGLSLAALRQTAKELGADLPYCLAGGFARVGGIGEDITPLSRAPLVDLVLIQPEESLSTRQVFERFRFDSAGPPADIPALIQALRENRLEDCPLYARNQLLSAASALCPGVLRAREALMAREAVFAQMSGAGSLVYGVFENANKALLAHQELRRNWPVCLISQTVAV